MCRDLCSTRTNCTRTRAVRIIIISVIFSTIIPESSTESCSHTESVVRFYQRDQFSILLSY